MLNVKDFCEVKCYKSKQRVHNQDYELICKHLNNTLDHRTIDGICLEFGVFKGRTINSMAKHDPNTIFYGFDSFKGLPEDWKKSLKTEKIHLAPKGTYSSKMPKVFDNVILIEGWFNETLPKFIDKYSENVSFLHIDCDLYSSAKTVLELLNNQIVNGTIIVFDELIDFRLVVEKSLTHTLYSNWAEHEWKALNEWVKQFNRIVEPISRTEYFQSAVRVIK